MSDHSLPYVMSPVVPRVVRRTNLLGVLRVLFRTVTTRRELRDLDTRLLDDIGISRPQALAEARRAPWEIGGS